MARRLLYSIVVAAAAVLSILVAFLKVSEEPPGSSLRIETQRGGKSGSTSSSSVPPRGGISGTATLGAEVLSPPLDSEAPSGTISGRVLAEENLSPMPDVVVRLALDLPGNSLERVPWIRSIYTDQEGRFEFKGLPYAPYRLGASYPGRVDEDSFGVLPGVYVKTRLAADPGIACKVEVDLDSGREPLPGQTVQLAIPSESWALEAETDLEGFFLITGILGERFEKARKRLLVEVIVPGYADPSLLSSSEQKETPYTILVDQGSTVFGRLLDKNTGKPLPTGTVVADSGHTVLSDEAGEYRISGVKKGLTAYAPGYAPETKDLDEFAKLELTNPLEVAFQLSKGLTLYGEVTDSKENPLKGVRVGIAPGELDLYIDEERMELRLLEELSATTDGKGHYLIEGLPPEALGVPGSVEIEIRPPGSVRGIVQKVDVDAEDGAVRHDIALNLVRAVTGSVKGTAGAALKGVRISVDSVEAGNFQVTATDLQGRFELKNLPVGYYHLAVEVHDRPVLIRKISVPAEPLNLRLEPGRTLKGTVFSEKDGAPFADLPVRLVFFAGSLVFALVARTDDSGTFSFEEVPPGEFYVELKAPSLHLPFNAHAPYHRVAVDLTAGDWTGDIQYPVFPSGEVLFRFYQKTQGGQVRELDDLIEVHVLMYRRDRLRVGSPSGGRRRRGFAVGKASRTFRKFFREGQYTFRCSLQKVSKIESLTLNEGDVVERQVVFTSAY